MGERRQPDRFPIGPLADLAWASGRLEHRGEVVELARLLGVSQQTVYRGMRDGLGVDAADRAALALGLHPFLVWGDAWIAREELWRWRQAQAIEESWRVRTESA